MDISIDGPNSKLKMFYIESTILSSLYAMVYGEKIGVQWYTMVKVILFTFIPLTIIFQLE